MPSPFGHALAGVAVAWTMDPRAGRRLAIVAAGLAALPDVDLLLPFRHRTLTHSVSAVIVATIIAAVVTGQVTRGAVRRTACVCGAAYASHLLLDWLAVDPSFPFGIEALWPFSDRFFISGWDVFGKTAREHIFTWPAIIINLKAIAGEMAILGPIAWALWLVRVKPAARLAAEMPRRHHPAQ